MKTPTKLCCLAALVCCVLSITAAGCNSQQPYPQQNQPGWNVDAHGPGWNVDVDGQFPARPYHPNVQPTPYQPPRRPCPGPYCPNQSCPCPQGNCPCPQGNPAVDVSPDPGPSKPDPNAVSIRSGASKCVRCMQPKVGEDWRSLWTANGGVATYLCKDCWNRTTPEQHAGYLRLILQRARLNQEKQRPFHEALKTAMAAEAVH